MDANIIITRQRDKFYTEKLAHACGDPKETYRIVNHLLDKEFSKKQLPNGPEKEVANNLKNFFHDKVSRIYTSIDDSSNSDSLTSDDEDIQPTKDVHQHSAKVSEMNSFKLMTSDEVASVIRSMGNKSCSLDPIPTWLLKQCLNELLPAISLIVNVSLQSGIFPELFKTALR